jgi:hypothetical protein
VWTFLSYVVGSHLRPQSGMLQAVVSRGAMGVGDILHCITRHATGMRRATLAAKARSSSEREGVNDFSRTANPFAGDAGLMRTDLEKELSP